MVKCFSGKARKLQVAGQDENLGKMLHAHCVCKTTRTIVCIVREWLSYCGALNHMQLYIENMEAMRP